uniref:Uncharacterized protein n=1 Tax=Timema monikensis TaxID=170555 RepID=A0A7R9E4E5_9NEOP|nr:unnamed protein product [Timema monikensis]
MASLVLTESSQLTSDSQHLVVAIQRDFSAFVCGVAAVVEEWCAKSSSWQYTNKGQSALGYTNTNIEMPRLVGIPGCGKRGSVLGSKKELLVASKNQQRYKIVLETIIHSPEGKGSNAFSFLHSILSSKFLVNVVVLAEVLELTDLGLEVTGREDVLKAMHLVEVTLAGLREKLLPEVKEGFINQINMCRDRGLNPGPPAQKSDTLPLDLQVTKEVGLQSPSGFIVTFVSPNGFSLFLHEKLDMLSPSNATCHNLDFICLFQLDMMSPSNAPCHNLDFICLFQLDMMSSSNAPCHDLDFICLFQLDMMSSSNAPCHNLYFICLFQLDMMSSNAPCHDLDCSCVGLR